MLIMSGDEFQFIMQGWGTDQEVGLAHVCHSCSVCASVHSCSVCASVSLEGITSIDWAKGL